MGDSLIVTLLCLADRITPYIPQHQLEFKYHKCKNLFLINPKQNKFEINFNGNFIMDKFSTKD